MGRIVADASDLRFIAHNAGQPKMWASLERLPNGQCLLNRRHAGTPDTKVQTGKIDGKINI